MFRAVCAALVAKFVLGFQIPHLPKTLGTNVAKIATASAIVGSSAYLGFFSPLIEFNMQQSVLVANAANPKDSKSVFEGLYNDPNHPGCFRKISVKGKDVTIIGSDELDGSKQWKIKAKEDYPGTIFVDFSPKGGPSDLLGAYDEKDGGIRWPDNNLWSKIK
eukprot:CAMPEP_0182418224 /NCGR_PEP_ID=MMETSP1167-20130531/2712_1 /TAXON_ID=2988 /ORGANISM="Mallomonas Sp, Strain CCMP3275" /LENGTH=161 /DNA_ID=CAMNT_0024592341 /DNA_START=117 /DNA_END=602 /DNA_ORIENTATION=+